MDKTININIGGSLFQIDDEAYRILRDYLQAINNRFRNVQGGHETIEDIEFRIAEIFQSQKGLAGVVTKENVEAMISIIGKPEDFDLNEAHTEQPSYSSHRKRMYRNPDDTIISGVCGGLGAYLDTDPVLFRILFVVFGLLFGVGFLLYVVLWIALPLANSDNRKREMYGNDYHSAMSYNSTHDAASPAGSTSRNSAYNTSSPVGNAFNEIFRAIGKVCWIIMRIFMILFGIIFVITGFIIILSCIMVIFFRFPGVFSADGMDIHLTYFQDFLGYIVSPSSAPWIIGLSLIVVLLPMLALIYLGVKMIFWFSARDGIYSLSALVLWVLSGAALSMLLFNEGISFAETGRSSTQTIIANPPDTLYIITDHGVSDLNFDKQFSLPDEDYYVYMTDSIHQLSLSARLRLNMTPDDLAKVEIRKRSSARTRSDAVRKAESLIYNYRISNDTLLLDEYFSLPAGSRWTADFLTVNLFIPENTVLYFDESSEHMFNNDIEIRVFDNEMVTESRHDYDTQSWELGNKYWIISEDGLKESGTYQQKQK